MWGVEGGNNGAGGEKWNGDGLGVVMVQPSRRHRPASSVPRWTWTWDARGAGQGPGPTPTTRSRPKL